MFKQGNLGKEGKVQVSRQPGQGVAMKPAKLRAENLAIVWDCFFESRRGLHLHDLISLES